jgi:poly-gamma-glutamate capsule biosynthesis protein CapA/YwtB (metallophosphatase superfamily)
MRRDIGAVAVAAAMVGIGLGGFGSYHRQSHRRRYEPSIDEVEERWVRERLAALNQSRRKAAKVIAELAKAFGPWAHRFGYAQHPENRAVARRLRQQARLEAKRRG